ncbi:MAG: hypothetical protein ACRD1R_19455 [Acidobacteriota bacterium]
MNDEVLSLLQREVLTHLAQGYPTERVLERCAITYPEFQDIVQLLKKKFQARSIQEAVVCAFDLGIIQL